MTKPSDFSSSSQDESQPASSEGVENIVYTCPTCGVAVITITGNVLTCLKDHVRLPEDMNNLTSFTINAYHPGEVARPNSGAYHPGERDLPPSV